MSMPTSSSTIFTMAYLIQLGISEGSFIVTLTCSFYLFSFQSQARSFLELSMNASILNKDALHCDFVTIFTSAYLAG